LPFRFFGNRLFFAHASSAQAATLYYNNAAGDYDWNTLGNWWTDPVFSSPAPNLPAVGDDVVISANVNGNSGPAAAVNTMTVKGTYTDIYIP